MTNYRYKDIREVVEKGLSVRKKYSECRSLDEVLVTVERIYKWVERAENTIEFYSRNLVYFNARERKSLNRLIRKFNNAGEFEEVRIGSEGIIL